MEVKITADIRVQLSKVFDFSDEEEYNEIVEILKDDPSEIHSLLSLRNSNHIADVDVDYIDFEELGND